MISDMVPSSSADVTRALCGCFRGGSVYVSFMFRFKAKENLQHCGNVFDILITSKGASVLGMFNTFGNSNHNFQ